MVRLTIMVGMLIGTLYSNKNREIFFFLRWLSLRLLNNNKFTVKLNLNTLTNKTGDK